MSKLEKIKTIKKPGKKLVKRIAAVAIALTVLAGAGAFAIEKVESKQEQKAYDAKVTMITNEAATTGTTLITQEEATQTALSYAGVSEDAVKYLKVKLDSDDDDYANVRYVYEVEFVYDGLEYDIDVNGVENTILKSNVESIYD